MDVPGARTRRSEPEQLTFGQHLLAFGRELAAVVIGAVLVASLLRYFVGQLFVIPSESMQDTLQVGDRVAVEKLTAVRRGEVVVFADPGGWLNEAAPVTRGPVRQVLQFVGVLPDDSTEHLIKRLIGLPGDHVVCCNQAGRVSVNGQPLDETGYLYREQGGPAATPSAIRFDVVVPDRRIFVMGDNRADSRDSRCHLNDSTGGEIRGSAAFVPEDLVVGRAIAVVWPLERRHRLPIPATFDHVPPAKTPAPSTPEIDAGPEASC